MAFFGASNRFSSIGTNQLNSLLDLGFEGNIYPIHPKEERVLAFKAYKKVQDLPEVPDLAVMVLPTQIVPGVMEECGQKGIKHAVVVSGGFKEVGGDGAAHEKKLLIAARFALRQHLKQVRKVAHLNFFDRLFSLWHILHLPFFFMLVI